MIADNNKLRSYYRLSSTVAYSKKYDLAGACTSSEKTVVVKLQITCNATL